LRHALAGLDYLETINFSFVEARWEQDLAGNADPIRVLNPIAAPLAVMRSSLIGSLVACIAPQPGAQGSAGAGVRAGPRLPP
jgi:phenylalanyl-tRNA synthetase beta chain